MARALRFEALAVWSVALIVALVGAVPTECAVGVDGVVAGNGERSIGLISADKAASRTESVAPAAPQMDQASSLDQATHLYRNGEVLAAIAQLESESCDSPLSVPKLYFLAQAYRKLKQVDLSVQYFQQALSAVAAEGNLGDLSSKAYAFWVHFEYAEVLASDMDTSRPMQNWTSINSYKQEVVEHYEAALRLESAMEAAQLPDLDRARIHNTIGLLLLEMGDAPAAIHHFETSIAFDAAAVEPYGNIVLAKLQIGDVPAAVEWSFTALKIAPNQPAVLHNTGVSLNMLGRNEEALPYWKRANELNPGGIEPLCGLATYYGSAGDTEGAIGYLEKAEAVARHALESNPQHLGSREQYNSIRLQLATAQLPMLYQSAQEILQVRQQFEASLEELSSQPGFVLPKALSTTIGSGSMGYYAIYQGFNDVEVRAKLSEIYLNAAPFLAFTAPHVARNRRRRYRFRPAISAAEGQIHENQPDVVVLKRRIRVGFHSAFMRHHSVGLLTQGVIMGLSPHHFEVVVILYERQVQDEVTRRVLAAVENAIFLHDSDIQRAQQQVAALELDILVFTEIGMDIPTYFLAFSRLALRTVVFWGHATTSGMTSPDFFVSSRLFQNPRDDSDDQGRYSECVYHMQHLTTYFTPPVSPSELAHLRNADAIRKLLGLPSTQSMSVMFLIPQTLYKLHPDFDALLGRILDRVPKSFLVVTTGNTPVLAEQIKQRWRRVLPPHIYRRVYFVRRLETTEFLELAAATHVVLDTFPVGGGRSSFEVFAVGTPIVAHVPRTSILQLTLGMYRAMGMEDEAGVAFSDDEYVEKAVALAINHTARQNLRRRILANSHRLYEDRTVIDEWESFLTAIMAAKPPESATTGRARTNECCSSS